MFASGCTDFHMKAKGRWAGDIAYIYSRFCPDMERECVRAMGRTDATPFMESSDAHWASIANWTEDDMDLGMMKSSMTATDRFRTTTQTTMTISMVEVGFEVRCFLRLRSRRDVAFRLAPRDATCYATGLVPDQTLTNSAVVPTLKNLSQPERGPQKLKPFSSQLGTTVAWQLFQCKWEYAGCLPSLIWRLTVGRHLTCLHGKQACLCMESKQLTRKSKTISQFMSAIITVNGSLLGSNFEMMPQEEPELPLFILLSHIATVAVRAILWIFRSPRPTIPLLLLLLLLLLVSPSLRSSGLFPSASQLPTVGSVLLLCGWCFLRLRSRRGAAFRLDATRRHVPRNRPRPRPALTNSVVVPTLKNLSSQRGAHKN